MRTCSTYCGTTTHVMSMIPRHQTAQPYATTSFASSIAMPYAVDAPNGDHDFQDLEESSGWVKRTILVASVTEDADAITEMHNAVLQGKRVYAVDAPDGEHDLEDMDPEKVSDAHQQFSELAATDFYNAKY
ncbi:hypothetical protein ACHAWU_009117 [Discostella pseudostelligera]|uniref:Uncharacterized protein n=1 Tax=Discostella pseudostelligera TaxID=259834 RepID=A0ABD3M8W0_9STRA